MSSGAPLPSSFDDNEDFYQENRWQKLTRRLREEPLIPLGLTLTCMALYGAAKSIKAGDHERTNRMFRARVYAQGFTVLAMVIGSIYWKTDRQKRKEYETLLVERNSQAKRDAWIRELEARDEEEKALRAKRQRLVDRQRAVEMETARGADELPSAAAALDRKPPGSENGVVDTVKSTLDWPGRKS